MGVGVIRRERQRAFDAGDAAIGLAGLVIEHAEKMQRLDVIGIRGEHLLIEALRLDEMTGAVQRDCRGEIVLTAGASRARPGPFRLHASVAVRLTAGRPRCPP